MITGTVLSVNKSNSHSFSKQPCSVIRLIKGLGVQGDIHAGKSVKHRSRVAKDPNQPNLRQVHLIPVELFEELDAKDYQLHPGDMGENITTQGIDLIGLPTNTILSIGRAKIQITGLRNPCNQLNQFQEGLMQAVLDKDENGNLIRKAGIMGIVLEGGLIECGAKIYLEYPIQPHVPLDRV